MDVAYISSCAERIHAETRRARRPPRSPRLRVTNSILQFEKSLYHLGGPHSRAMTIVILAAIEPAANAPSPCACAFVPCESCREGAVRGFEGRGALFHRLARASRETRRPISRCRSCAAWRKVLRGGVCAPQAAYRGRAGWPRRWLRHRKD